MAATNRTLTPKQQLAAERVAGFGAEQRRLKEEAATRRAAAASHPEQIERGFSTRHARRVAAAPPSRYLR
jgi:hypothetical protein